MDLSLMVETIVSVLKEGWRLSSPLLWVALVVTGVILSRVRRESAAGRRWLTGVLLAYWILSTPLGATFISAPLMRGHPRLTSPQQASGATAVVVLGAGIVSYTTDGMAIDDLMTSAFRVIEGVRVYRLLGDPLLIVSGGNTQQIEPPRSEAAAFRDAAIRLGVPASRIVMDTESQTTREQAITMKQLLGERGIDRFVLVTSAIHMGRSLRTFRAVGLDPVPSSSALADDDESRWSIVPARWALMLSDAATYEYAAWIYYWSRGWFRPPAS
jgi:uncharacterized SAM-binding protein YcdF (DUF218 family)